MNDDGGGVFFFFFVGDLVSKEVQEQRKNAATTAKPQPHNVAHANPLPLLLFPRRSFQQRETTQLCRRLCSTP